MDRWTSRDGRHRHYPTPLITTPSTAPIYHTHSRDLERRCVVVFRRALYLLCSPPVIRLCFPTDDARPSSPHWPPSMLIQPGETFHRDCRPPRSDASSALESSLRGSSPLSLRVVQWNIERGYELPSIVRLLKEVDADVIALQEVDVGCERSGGVDTGLVIAEALRLNYLYTCEFHELRSPLRSPRLQGGDEGHHGHALLSKWDLRPCAPVVHPHQAVDWAAEGASRKEPRRGRRVTMKAVVDCGGGASLLVYCGHFEVFAGLLDRLHALADVLQDAREETPQHPTQLILADCNTMAHGIARLSVDYCRDWMRWGSLGWTEAEWWTHFVLDVLDSSTPINHRLLPFLPSHSPLLSRLRNPDPGFWEAFDPYDDVTLHSHRGLYSGKLDWSLVRGDVAVQRHWLENHDYTASDHKLMAMDLQVGGGVGAGKGGRQSRGRVRRRWPGLCTCTTSAHLHTLQLMTALAAVAAMLAYIAVLYRNRDM